MKKLILILTILLVTIFTINAQIPNSGFESWTDHTTYIEPDGWSSCNAASAGTFYPISRASDPYPVTIGNYSIRLENNPSLLPSYEALGFAWTLPLSSPLPAPSFPISGHPTSLTGYYKWAPQGGDTMFIQIILYHEKVGVAYDEFSTTTTATSWTPFTIPISSYADADSALIIISAYYCNGPNNIPYGNSVLNVDNLNFDNLISSIPEQIPQKHSLNIFPNPASDFITLNIDNSTNNAEINIYDVLGDLVKSEKINQGQNKINISDLSNGFYMLAINSKDIIEAKKLIIQK